MDFNKTKMVLAKGVMFAAAGLGSVGIAGATMNMTASFQPIIDMIGVITTNTDTWVALVVLSVILTMCVAVGHFVKGILNKSVGSK